MDPDSSAILASEGEHLPYSLYYDEDYINGPDNSIKELLEKGNYYLFKSGSYKNDLDSALPLLLFAKLKILNEAITNAIKYAFEKTEDGKISISLTHISNSQILLTIADNGAGLPTDFATKTGASMGMELLQGLTYDLGGVFNIETRNGTCLTIIFDNKSVTAALASLS